MSDEIVMRAIGRVRSCFNEKFATPRQSGLVPSAEGEVVFFDEVDPIACRGLEGFSHVWLIFLFNKISEQETRWAVRPPRLGGNEKQGVLATRSPFRPNRIGLSLVKLESVQKGLLRVSGLDLVDDTPILDVKPYLPYVEAIPHAVGGFAQSPPEPLPVEIADEFAKRLGAQKTDCLREVLSNDPRPAYHEDSNRIYGCRLFDFEIKWQVSEGVLQVLSVE